MKLSFLLLGVVMAVAASTAHAQIPGPFTDADLYYGYAYDGSVSVEAKHDGSVRHRMFPGPWVTATSAFRNPVAVGIIDTTCFVVVWAGPTPDQVSFEYWNKSAGSLTPITSTAWVGASDLVRVIFDSYHQVLYRFDGWTGELQYLLWSSGPTSPLFMSWNPISLIGLPSQVESFGRFAWIGDSSQASGKYLFVGEPPESLTRYGLTLEGHPASPVLSYVNLHRSFVVPNVPSILVESVQEGATHLEVSGEPGQAIEIQKISTGGIVGTGSTPMASSVGVIPLSIPLEIGERYCARYSGQASWSRSAMCFRRYTNSAAAGSGLTFTPLYEVKNAYIGNLAFRFTADLETSAPPASPVQMSGVAIAGLAPGNTNSSLDPIIMLAGLQLLDLAATTLLPMEGQLLPSGLGYLDLELPIPDDPQLVGQIMLVQAAVDDGTGLIASNIIGVKISSAP